MCDQEQVTPQADTAGSLLDEQPFWDAALFASDSVCILEDVAAEPLQYEQPTGMHEMPAMISDHGVLRSLNLVPLDRCVVSSTESISCATARHIHIEVFKQDMQAMETEPQTQEGPSDIVSADVSSIYSWEVQATGEKTEERMTSNHATRQQQDSRASHCRRALAKRTLRRARERWGPIRAAQRQRGCLSTLPRVASRTKDAADPAGAADHSVIKEPSSSAGRSSNSIVCSTCGAIFDSHAVYRRHAMFKHSLGCRVPCRYCPRTFRRPDGRDKHIRQAHACRDASTSAASSAAGCPVPSDALAASMHCSLCSRSFATVDALAAHLSSPAHFGRITEGNAVAAAQLFTSHHADVLRLCPYQCLLCDFQCASAECFVDHLKSQRHSEVTARLTGPMLCERCDFFSYNVSDIIVHVTTTPAHHCTSTACRGRERPARLCMISEKRSSVSCQHCGQRCHSATQLARHRESMHGCARKKTVNSSVQCTYCSFLARSNHNLIVHIRRRHTKEKPYACEYCPAAFADRFSLTVHFKTKKHKDAVLKSYIPAFEESDPAHASAQRHRPGLSASTSGEDRTEPGTSADAVASSERFTASSSPVAAYTNAVCRRGAAADRVRCRHCSYRAASNSAMRKHYIEQHYTSASASGPRMTAAGSCRSSAGAGNSLSDEPCPQVGHRCSVCGDIFSDTVQFEIHRLSHVSAMTEKDLGESDRIGPLNLDFLRSCCTSSRRVACPECGKHLSGNRMPVHMRVHSGHKPYSCVICCARFSQCLQLNKHLRSHFAVKVPTFKCRVCRQSFGSVQERLPHERKCRAQQLETAAGTEGSAVPASLGSFICPEDGCGRTFSEKRGLLVHLRRHNGEKPYVCGVCGYKSVSPSERARHKKVHSGTAARSHTCDYCPYTAPSAYHLRRHLRVHTGSKPYSCPYCAYRCNTEHNVRKHILQSSRHTGLHVYRCPLVADASGNSNNRCSFACNAATELTEHVRRCHSEAEAARAAASAARFTGLLNSADDVNSVPEGSLVLNSRWRTVDPSSGTDDDSPDD